MKNEGLEYLKYSNEISNMKNTTTVTDKQQKQLKFTSLGE